jgi:hypothetical protein
MVASCVQCHDKMVEQNWTVTLQSLKLVQCYNLCGSCASDAWTKYKHTPTMEGIRICVPKSSSEFKKLSEDNDGAYGSSWCQYYIGD